MSEVFGEDPEVILAERRYDAIAKIMESAVRKKESKWTFTDMLDHVFLHKALGIPIFLALLWAVFQFTFAFSEPFMVMVEMFFGWLGGLAADGIANPQLASFVADGICGGLGSVLVFVPPIFMLFLALAILEDSGYLSRAAFVMDRVMYKLGLHGRSFIPMISGFGCNIPAIMATRSIENEKDRM
ncbi:MAG: nucleoside recognition domain-containing protein, partial [Euryarchaeota archaeon]|nr:nucleoside recognition domain-containing protein [Euryarchaeota archaeon]